jgi:hypothetical protein
MTACLKHDLGQLPIPTLESKTVVVVNPEFITRCVFSSNENWSQAFTPGQHALTW